MRRLSRASHNITIGFFNHFLLMIFPFIVRAVMIKRLGIDYLGVSSLFASILGILALADLGFSSAAAYFLYKPIVEENQQEINALLLFFRRIFRIVGLVILVFGLGIMPFLENLVSGTYPSDINIYIVYLLQLFSTVSGYFFFSYKSIILSANQRNDVESIVYTASNAIMYVLQIALLLIFSNYYTYAVVLPAFSVITNILRSVVADKLFPSYKCEGEISKELKREIYKRVAALFGHKMNMKVIQTADSVVLSAILGLAILGKYSNYFYILSALAVVTSVITENLRPIVGNSLICVDRNQNIKTLKNFLFIYSWIIGFCCVCLVCLYQNWMVIWVGADNLLPFSTVILFAIYFWIWKIGDVFMLYRDAGGLWIRVKFYPYVSAALNLITNIILVKYIGVNGVIISTVLTLLCISLPCEIHALFKYLFEMPARKTVFLVLKYTVIATLCTLITYMICIPIGENTLISFIERSAICFILPNLIYFLLFRKTSEFAYFKDFLVSKIKRK